MKGGRLAARRAVLDFSGTMIRPMDVEDVDAIMETVKDMPNPWSRPEFVDAFREKRQFLFALCGAQAPRRLMAFSIWQYIEPQAELFMVATRPEWRRNGCAECLLRDNLDWLKSEKAKQFSLEVRISNAPAIAMYEKLGFKTIHLRREYYHRPVEDGFIMELKC